MDVELLGEYFYKSKNCNENQPNSGLLPAVPAHLRMADLGLSNRGLSSPRTPCSGRACAHAGGRAEPPRPVPAARVLLPTVPVAVDSRPPAASSPEEAARVLLPTVPVAVDSRPPAASSPEERMSSSVVHSHVWTDTRLWEELPYGVCVRMALPQNRKARTGLGMRGAEGAGASPGATSVFLRAQQSVFLMCGTKCGYVQNKVILTSNHLFCCCLP